MNTAPNNASRFVYALTAIGLLTLLAGCSPFASPGIQPDRYTLGPAPAIAADHGTSESTRIPLTLHLSQVTAPDWLDSNRMVYRLNYGNDQQLASYTRSEWAATPAEMVTDNLRTALRNRHLFAAVVDDTTGQANLSLQLGLTDFSQQFSDVKTSQGHITATATLVNTHTGEVMAQRTFEMQAPAPSADAAGGAHALAKADQKLDTAIARWLAKAISACAPGCTRSD